MRKIFPMEICCACYFVCNVKPRPAEEKEKKIVIQTSNDIESKEEENDRINNLQLLSHSNCYLLWSLSFSLIKSEKVKYYIVNMLVGVYTKTQCLQSSQADINKISIYVIEAKKYTFNVSNGTNHTSIKHTLTWFQYIQTALGCHTYAHFHPRD